MYMYVFVPSPGLVIEGKTKVPYSDRTINNFSLSTRCFQSTEGRLSFNGLLSTDISYPFFRLLGCNTAFKLVHGALKRLW